MIIEHQGAAPRRVGRLGSGRANMTTRPMRRWADRLDRHGIDEKGGTK
jgi:hypothetical protein